MAQGWRDYKDGTMATHHSVVGQLKVCEQLWSPQLNNQRDIFAYLPPSYEQSERRYPVIYMQDGQNLFDKAISYAGEWQVDETMEMLSGEGIEALIVGIPNTGGQRLIEYSPFVDAYHGQGRGQDYLAFVTETIKPLIDNDFRTLPGRATTGIAGSSMGGLISLYAYFAWPQVFGLTAAMSPSLWYAQGAMLAYVQKAPFLPGKIYLDAGTREFSDRQLFRSRRYYGSVRRLQRLLVKKGYRPARELLHVQEKAGQHNEAAWARRLPRALRFLLGGAGS